MNQTLSSESIGQLLGRVGHLQHKRMHSMLEEMGLYRGQPFVLRALWEQEGQTHTELANRLRRTRATLSNMIKRMEKAGFVERRSDPHDERVSRVFLTPAGREIKARVEAAWQSFEAQTFTGFDQVELDALHALLERVRDNLQQKEP